MIIIPVLTYPHVACPWIGYVKQSYFFCLMHQLYTYGLSYCPNKLEVIHSVSFLLLSPYFLLNIYSIPHPYILVRSVCQGLLIEPHKMPRKVRTLSIVRHPELVALYASAPNHVLGQQLGQPGSLVLVPYVPLYRLRQRRENYCDCVPVLPDEHLSRESRKLTVMMRRELVAVHEVVKSLKKLA